MYRVIAFPVRMRFSGLFGNRPRPDRGSYRGNVWALLRRQILDNRGAKEPSWGGRTILKGRRFDAGELYAYIGVR
jgi:hypothetical protein